MKLPRCIFWGVALAAVSVNGKGIEDAMEESPFISNVADCDALSEAAAIYRVIPHPGGTLHLLGPIHCRKPTYIEFKADTVVESQNAIDTTNLAYIVLPGVQLVFRAPAVSLKRGEAMELEREAILYNEMGLVKFEVTAPYPSYVADGSTVDEHGMVWSQDEKLSSNKQPHFTEYEVVVADSADATIEAGKGLHQLLAKVGLVGEMEEAKEAIRDVKQAEGLHQRQWAIARA